MKSDELPATWASVPLSDFAIGAGRSVQPQHNPEEVFDLYSVPAYERGEPDRVTGSEIKSNKQEVAPRQVLLCKIVPHLNRVWVVGEQDERRKIASGEWIRYSSAAADPCYLRYLLSSPDFREEFMTTVSGVGGSLLRARPQLVDKIEVPVAPLNEQRRIVAKVDHLSARSRAARDHLARVEKLAARAKQAILSAAFRGDLTEEWRAEAAVEPIKSDAGEIDGRIPDLGELPALWGWVAVETIADVTGGLTKNRNREALPLRAPYLRVANVYANELRLNEISQIGCSNEEKARTTLRTGDLLVVEGNGSRDQIGRVAMWRGEVEGCLHQNHLIRVRPHQDSQGAYLLYWMLSPGGRTAIEAVASSSSGLHTLSISKVKGLPVPACDPAEQRETVRRIEAAFASIDRLTAEAGRAAHLLDRLDERLLAKAFRGELVPQDPNDEPAEVLLAHMRDARAAMPKARRGGRRKAS